MNRQRVVCWSAVEFDLDCSGVEAVSSAQTLSKLITEIRTEDRIAGRQFIMVRIRFSQRLVLELMADQLLLVSWKRQSGAPLRRSGSRLGRQ